MLSFMKQNNNAILLLCFSNLPPSQGGRYAGFGNTVETKKEDDFFDNTFSSLSSVSYTFNFLIVIEQLYIKPTFQFYDIALNIPFKDCLLRPLFDKVGGGPEVIYFSSDFGLS